VSGHNRQYVGELCKCVRWKGTAAELAASHPDKKRAGSFLRTVLSAHHRD
jgi:hypothetical protein